MCAVGPEQSGPPDGDLPGQLYTRGSGLIRANASGATVRSPAFGALRSEGLALEGYSANGITLALKEPLQGI